MNVDAQRVIAHYQAELAAMTMRALAAEAAVEAAVEQLREEAAAREGGAETEEVR